MAKANKSIEEEEASLFAVFDERPLAYAMTVAAIIWFSVYFIGYKTVFMSWKEH